MSPVRVVVVGDALLDRDVDGTSTRLSPDAPVPVVDVDDVFASPGGAGLAALLCACGPGGPKRKTDDGGGGGGGGSSGGR